MKLQVVGACCKALLRQGIVARAHHEHLTIVNLAPDIHRALQASAEEMAEVLTRTAVDPDVVDRCVRVGLGILAKGEVT